MMVDDLLEAWRVNNAVNLEMLGLCPDDSFDLKPGKGKTIRSNFVHIIWCRGQRIKEKFSKAEVPELDWKTANREQIREALISTEAQMREVFVKRIDKPDRFKPMTFFAYMVAHEAHHRSQIEISLRMSNWDLPEMTIYNLWDWAKK
jgi:uncharacterized damage-inducible protein DinB